jgi:hypothetical protein
LGFGARCRYEKIGQLNIEAERLKADNLALQTAMLPRNIGLVGIDEPAPADKAFAGIEHFAGTRIEIQTVSEDNEADRLTQQIIFLLKLKGWVVSQSYEGRTGIMEKSVGDGLRIMYPIGKYWTAEEPNQPWFAWKDAAEALARGLTAAHMGAGPAPVPVSGFFNNPPRIRGMLPYFNPPLEGVYLQVGSRPVSETIEWITRGRPDVSGQPAR